jgi:protein gp37
VSQASRIEWTDATWNPVTGCSRTSPGCDHCYAERMAARLQAMGNPRYADGFKLTLHWDKIGEPLKWRQSRRVFVNSMSDLFHEDVPAQFIDAVFATMTAATRHEFQVLTKRARRLPLIAPSLSWTANVWLGVSIENKTYAWRADYLREVPAAVRFLSVEPLIGPAGQLDLDGIDWVIVGGESGPGARPMHPDWARDVRDQCRAAGVAFFFKQWGGINKKATGRLLDGRTWDEFPVPRLRDVRVTEDARIPPLSLPVLTTAG